MEVSAFQVTIPKTKEVPDGKKSVTFYCIEVVKRGVDKWSLEKRYREFDELHVALKKTHGNLPSLPGKSILALNSANEIEKRRVELEKYLQGIMTRTDLISADPVKRFLQIENFAPEHAVTPPKLVAELDTPLGVRDFYLDIKEGILFTSISDMNVTSRVDSYLTNMKLPWEKELPQGAMITVGAVECYIMKDKAEYKFDKLWTKTFQTQVIVLYWDAPSCLLVTGKDDGSITVLKVSSELGYLKYDEVVSNKCHLARVMGVYLDTISQLNYSVSEDKKLKVLDINKNMIVADLPVGNEKHTALIGDKDNKRIFISNRAGQVFIYDISTKEPKIIHTIQAHPQKNATIRGLYFDHFKNYLFTANYDDGVVAIIDLQKPGKEKYASTTATCAGKPKVRAAVWSTNRYEIYTGNEDGTLTFWDVKKISPLYAMKAHNSGICRLEFLEKANILVSAGKDKKIKFHQLPDEWRDKRLEAEIMKESRIAKQNENMNQYKKQMEIAQNDSDEDDLLGWHK